MNEFESCFCRAFHLLAIRSGVMHHIPTLILLFFVLFSPLSGQFVYGVLKKLLMSASFVAINYMSSLFNRDRNTIITINTIGYNVIFSQFVGLYLVTEWSNLFFSDGMCNYFIELKDNTLMTHYLLWCPLLSLKLIWISLDHIHIIWLCCLCEAFLGLVSFTVGLVLISK